MHIPKTAGSSINNFFGNIFGSEYSLFHLETIQDWETLSDTYFQPYVYIAGHTPFPRVSKRLEGGQWRTFSVIRDPFDHLISHISWVKNLVRTPRRFRNSPRDVQKLSRRLNEINFNDVDDVAKFFHSPLGLALSMFDNRQVRYFSDPPDDEPATEKSFKDALITTQNFTFVGVFERLKETIAYVVGNWFTGHAEFIPEFSHVNVYNPKVPNHSNLKDVLEPFFRYDCLLYQFLVERFKTTLDNNYEIGS